MCPGCCEQLLGREGPWGSQDDIEERPDIDKEPPREQSLAQPQVEAIESPRDVPDLPKTNQ